MKDSHEILLQIDRLSKYRGFGRMFWITQILAGITGIATILAIAIYTLFHTDILFVIIALLFVLGMTFLVLDSIGGILLEKTLHLLKEKNREFGKIKDTVEEINTVLNIGNTILELIQKLSKFRYFIHIFYPKKMQTYNKLFYMQYSILIPILTDLRSDLSIRLSEQQKILESAIGEVSENIKGSTELSQVSELQKVRLDRQIEQFEELQKVLVKV